MQPKPLQCPVCQVGFTRGKQLACHIRKFHPSQVDDFLPLNLPVRQAVHPDELPYNCSFCSQNFRTEKSYKEHVRIKHPEVDKKEMAIYTCHVCHEGFNSFKPFFVHVEDEHGSDENFEILTKKYPAKTKLACRICKRTSYKTEQEFNKHLPRCKLKQEVKMFNNSNLYQAAEDIVIKEEDDDQEMEMDFEPEDPQIIDPQIFMEQTYGTQSDWK